MIPLFILLLVSNCLAECDDVYADQSDCSYNSRSNWMSYIDGNIQLSQLTLPGTHDSGTYPGYGGDWVQCQAWSIRDQLNAGVRFLDMRLRYYDGSFTIHHEQFYQYLNFDDVMGDILNFLLYDGGGMEAIVMTVKNEYCHKTNNNCDDDDNWANTWYKYRDQYSPYIVDNINGPPLLRDVRGRVVVIFRVNSVGYGLHWPSGDNDRMVGNGLDVDDHYKVWAWSVDDKKNYVTQHMQGASWNRERWYFTYSSASTGGEPWRFAYDYGLNQLVRDFADNNKVLLGVVIMDFPGNHAIGALVNCNDDLKAERQEEMTVRNGRYMVIAGVGGAIGLVVLVVVVVLVALVVARRRSMKKENTITLEENFLNEEEKSGL